MARDTVQADRLEAVLSGELAPEDVSTDLAQLATLASSLRDEVELEAPTEEFRTRLRAELLTAAAVPAPTLLEDFQQRVRDGAARLRDSLRVAGATAMASTLIGTTGVAAAAQAALPGDLLYGVKGVTEDVRMLFASDALERGRLHLTFAKERLEEIEDGVDRLSPAEFESAFDALDRQAAAGANLLLAEPPSPKIKGELNAFTAEVRHRLTEIAPHLPTSVRPATENTFEVLRRIDLQLRGLLVSSSCPDCGASTADQWLPRVVLPGDGPPAPGCDCTSATGSVTDDTVGEQLPTDDPASGPSLDEDLDPESPSDSSDLSDTVGETGELVDDVLDGTGDVVGETGETVGDTVEDVGSELDDAVDGDLGDTVGDVTEELGDTVEDTSSTVDDTLDGVGSTVEDTSSSVDSSVDDTSSAVEDTVDDTSSPLDDTGLLGGS